jgi:hypothetical protein
MKIREVLHVQVSLSSRNGVRLPFLFAPCNGLGLNVPTCEVGNLNSMHLVTSISSVCY